MQTDVDRMLRDIEMETRLTAPLTGLKILDPLTLHAMRRVPRHEFVPRELQRYAYDNSPATIGHGQTISQPYIVALMTTLLRPQPDHVVLEVGTGSGYQSAILAQLVSRVYTMEIIDKLHATATDRLHRLGYDNITTRHGDGYQGWPEHAPYDGIIVTAAAAHIPQPLVEQLTPGGCLVIPVGGSRSGQELLRLQKDAQGNVEIQNILAVAFVPLTGDGHVAPYNIV